MHRSGTSALTRLVSMLGAALPRTLLGGGVGNETGHWEPERLIAYHDRMLADLGSAWHDWTPLDMKRLPLARREQLAKDIAEIVDEDYGSAPLIVLKEPRIARFAPFFSGVLTGAGYDVKAIVPFRNPLDVIDSLLSRKSVWPAGHDRSDAALLWLTHMLEAERAARSSPHVVVSYESVMADPVEALHHVVGKLELETPRTVDEVGGDIAAFINEAQRHHESRPDEVLLDPQLTGWVADTYAALRDLEAGRNIDGAREALDRIREEFLSATPLLNASAAARRAAEAAAAEAREKLVLMDAERESLVAEKDRLATAREAAIGELRARLEEWGGHTSGLQAELDAARAAHAASEEARQQAACEQAAITEARESALNAARDELEGLRNQLAALNDERDAVVAERDRQAEALQARIAELDGHASGLQAELDAARAAHAASEEARQQAASEQAVAIKARESALNAMRDELEQQRKLLEERDIALAEAQGSQKVSEDRFVQAQAELEDLRKEIVDLTAQLDTARAEEAERQALLDQLAQATDSKHELEQALEARQLRHLKEIQTLSAELEAERHTAAAASATRIARLAELMQSQKNLESTLDVMRRENDRIVPLRADLERAKADASRAEDVRKSLEAELTGTRQQLAIVEAEKKTQVDALEMRVRKIGNEQTAALRESADARNDLDRARRKLEELERTAESSRALSEAKAIELKKNLAETENKLNAVSAAAEKAATEALAARQSAEEEIARLETEAGHLRAEFEKRNAEYVEAKAALAGETERAANFQAALEAEAAKARDFEVRLADTVNEADQARLKLQHAETEIVLTHDAYRKSTSWRLAAPIRGVKLTASAVLRFPRRIISNLRKVPHVVNFAGGLVPAGRKFLGTYRREGLDGIRWRMDYAEREGQNSRSGKAKPVESQIVVPDDAPAVFFPASRSSEKSDLGEQKYIQQVLSISGKKDGIDLEYVPRAETSFDLAACPLKLIAFYLPQFHPIPENDNWWGKGFTEWTNVSKAVPQFAGHYQPHLPGELGFYDLRLVDVQRQQAELAKQYGIYGFCYHHYWFGGKRLLERPVNQILANPDIDLPFCLCWANENWTRRWDGMEQDVLMAQNHSPEDDLAFIADLAPALRDPRYIRFDGRPVLIVYRVTLLPDPAATAKRWRDYCRREGIGDLYLVAARSFGIKDPRPYGFDASVEFPPHEANARCLNTEIDFTNRSFDGYVFSFDDMVDSHLAITSDEYPNIKTVCPGWDNEARKPGKGHIFYGSGPQSYSKWLRGACERTLEKIQNSSDHPPFVFVNAWNEWAEGAHLEPDRKFGYANLHVTANTLQEFTPLDAAIQEEISTSQEKFRRTSDGAVVLHLFYEDLLPELVPYLENAKELDLFVSLGPNVRLETVKKLRSLFPGCYIAAYPNRGRDVLPFVIMLQVLQSLGYKYACKVHTKKSLQREDGEKLRSEAFENLLGSVERVAKFKQMFEQDAQLGLAAPSNWFLDLSKPDRNVLNRDWLDKLLPKLGRDDLVGTYDWEFIAGTMFWFRVDSMSWLPSWNFTLDDFESELGQMDGTLAHSIERIVSIATVASGFKVTPI
ncbi:MAG: glycoside hydrolase family 99-like domain-containing protein [Brucellaceae bacterium]|nr:glycoside hydrolase family 99-like domain-containing protein [Brucellaceae bacterium]